MIEVHGSAKHLCSYFYHIQIRSNTPQPILQAELLHQKTRPPLDAQPKTYLLPVNTPLIRLQHHEPLARDVQPGALDLLDAILARVPVRGDDLLHFLRGDGEAGRSGPYAVAFVVEDGGFVDVAGADEAVFVSQLGGDEGG